MDQFDWLGGTGARTPPTPARGGGPATPSMPGATGAAAQAAQAAAAQAAAGGGAASGSASSSANSRQQRSLASAAPVDDWLHLSTLMLETLDDDPSTPSDAMLDEMALQRLMQSGGGGGGQASASSSSSSNVPFHQMSVSDMAIATQQAILASSLFANTVGGLGSLSPLDFPAMDNSLLGLGMGLGSGVSPAAGLNMGHIAGIPVLNRPVGMGLNVNPSQSSSSGPRKFSSPVTQVLASLTPPQKQRQSVGSLSSAAAAAATAPSAAAAASSSSSSSAPPVKVKTEQEMDKRKRNTEASARFRAKKKIKQQMLEMSTKELTERVELLERRLQEYSMEIIMLRQELACDTSGQRKSLRDIYAENNVEYHPENLTAAGQGMLERGLIGIGAVSNTSSTFELGLGPNQSDDGYAGSDYFGDMMGEQASGGQAEAHLDAMALNAAAAAAAAATAACENAPVLTSSALNQTGSSGSDNGSKRQKRK
ncbi:hypothetical protein HDU82_001971 [Entophlyctis luteolus]|nr:hypothetical protein HDU82_001971 [Entophlyctis luteolus]